MSPDPALVACFVTDECGLPFDGIRSSKDEIELRPAGVPVENAFALKVVTGWRNIDLSFVPGVYSGDLIAAMGDANQESRTLCAAVLTRCAQDGADVTLRIDGQSQPYDQPTGWPASWRRFELSMRKGQIDFGEPGADFTAVPFWTCRLAAAVVALLPLEEAGDAAAKGFPEGASIQVSVNRYERDRRNRAAAIAIHGVVCKACGTDMAARYGPVASGFIEVHHLTPVSRLGPGYVINPTTDLVPLCPNCHGVAHRREPPFTPTEIASMLRGKLF